MMKLALVALLAVLAQAVPQTKDLAADISDAKLKVGFFDIEVVEMINRLNTLQVELGLPVDALAQKIIDNLVTISEPGDVLPVRLAFRAFREDFQSNSNDLRLILNQQLRNALSNVYDQLDNDLAQVPQTTNTLKAHVANHELTYNGMWDSIYNRTAEADAAITTCINGQEGITVAQIYADWQTILDILENENFLSTNVKFVFDSRGNDALTALDLVISQIP
ncbi:Hypothetical predicted protein [Cloeon dipterum]|uniref:Uncharacterized protein n=2 Tax=Cloeon dipterum TaxID=197152 RepID=A0A8S1CJP5_9INSE|nr:Hypothetical predicted protein [Cloeon dipterum]